MPFLRSIDIVVLNEDEKEPRSTQAETERVELNEDEEEPGSTQAKTERVEKARVIIDDEDADQQYETSERRRQQMSNTASKAQSNARNPALEKCLPLILIAEGLITWVAPSLEVQNLISDREAPRIVFESDSKARAIIDDEDADQQYETSERRRQQMSNTASKAQYSSQYQLPENSRNADNPALEKGFGDYSSQYQLPENSRNADNPALQKGLNYIGGTIGNALENLPVLARSSKPDI
ncbi:hypothetical protein Tco_1361732 [Tanacetum coccineum]